MKKMPMFLSVVAIAAGAAAANADGGRMPPPHGPGGPPPQQGPGGPGGGPQNGGSQGGPERAPDAHQIAMLLAMVADADRSHDVTADEWSAFLASLNADATTGAVDMSALAAALPAPPRGAPAGSDMTTMLTRMFDYDQDGTVTLADLNALFALLDADGDGALSSTELAPPPRPQGDGQGGPGGLQDEGTCSAPDPTKAARALAQAADTDRSGDVSAEEWASFLALLNSDADTGAVDMTAFAAAVPHPGRGDATAGLTRVFDYDGDGTVTVSDLDSIFALLDANADGSATSSERSALRPVKGAAKRGALALFRAADADKSRDVSADEWAAFLDGLVVDGNGAVSLDDLGSKLGVRAPRSGDAAKRDAMLTREFDRDGDGVVTRTDLQAVFTLFDTNVDGALSTAELHGRR